MSIERLGQVWPEWRADALIGEGSFGKVYRAVREEHGMTTYSAIKVISIPQSEAELSSMRAEGWSEEANKAYLKGIVDDFVNEIKLLESLKGTPNIVSVEDYRVIEKTDRIGWDIFIRMELLTALHDFTSNRKLSEPEAVKLAEDILGALELCSQRNIIHRDIKPENIFISSFGYYKLGDFGIARELGKTSGSMSHKGTYNYIAPEVAIGRNYDATVDIYSLGLVLYRLLNNNRLPFLDPYAQQIQYQERKQAIDRRLGGQALPPPAEASAPLAQIVLKACAFDPRDRYRTPVEFRQALEALKAGLPIPKFVPSTDLDSNTTVVLNPAKQKRSNKKESKAVERFGDGKKKSKKPLVIAIIVLIVAAIGFAAYLYLNNMIKENYANQVIVALENQDYNEAIAVFNDKIDGDNIALLENNLSERLDSIRAGYRENEIEYSIAKMELETIRIFRIAGLSRKMTEIEQFIDSLNASRTDFNTAEAFLSIGEYVAAINHYKLVIEEDPNHENAVNGVVRATNEYRRVTLETATEYAENNDFDRAIAAINNALLALQNDSELTQQLTIYRTQQTNYKRQNALDTAAGHAAVNDWANAISTLENALRDLPDDSAILQQISSYEASRDEYFAQQENERRQEALSTAAGFAYNNDWSNAITTLENALREFPNDSAIMSLQSEYRAAYVAHVIAQVDVLISERKQDEAVALVNRALQDLPGNMELQQQFQRIEDSRPVSVFRLNPLNSNAWGYNEGVLEDSLGRTYSVTLPYKVAGHGHYAEYYVNSNYSAITGRIVPHRGFNPNTRMQFRIYADDVLVYTSPDIAQRTLEFEFYVNITGAEFVTIRVVRTEGGANSGSLLLLDMVFEK